MQGRNRRYETDLVHCDSRRVSFARADQCYSHKRFDQDRKQFYEVKKAFN